MHALNQDQTEYTLKISSSVSDILSLIGIFFNYEKSYSFDRFSPLLNERTNQSEL